MIKKILYLILLTLFIIFGYWLYKINSYWNTYLYLSNWVNSVYEYLKLPMEEYSKRGYIEPIEFVSLGEKEIKLAIEIRKNGRIENIKKKVNENNYSCESLSLISENMKSFLISNTNILKDWQEKEKKLLFPTQFWIDKIYTYEEFIPYSQEIVIKINKCWK